MLKTTINSDKISSFELVPERLDNTVVYKKVLQFNWKKFKFTREEKYVDDSYLSNRHITEEELKKRYPNQIIKNNKLYYKSEIRINTLGGKVISKQFDTQGEAETFYQTLNRKLTNKIEL